MDGPLQLALCKRFTMRTNENLKLVRPSSVTRRKLARKSIVLKEEKREPWRRPSERLLVTAKARAV